MIITTHAAERWCERIDPTADLETARMAIRAHSKAIHLAIEFGACALKLGCGAKLIFDADMIVTVYPTKAYRRRRVR